MASRIKVSFILGIYNAQRTLRECLTHLFMQDFPKANYEVLVIDGGSSDSTIGIVKEFMKKHKNMKLLHNPLKLSEGRGMSKDMGVKEARGEVVVFLDHDNIILEKTWLKWILEPFEDKKIMASQSLLQPRSGDPAFLQYINAVGVEDPFAIPYSLLAQVMLHPEKFPVENGKYYTYMVKGEAPLFGGANGCAFRKEVFRKIGGYTRDVDVFAAMGSLGMKVAVPLRGRIYHKTSSDLLSFIKKKAVYYRRFITNDYGWKKYRWIGSGVKGKANFALMIVYNLSILEPLAVSIREAVKRREIYWLIHAPFLFCMTIVYGVITLTKLGNFRAYTKKQKKQ